MEESSSEDTNLPNLESAAKVILEFGSPLHLVQLIDGHRNIFDQYLHAVDEIQQSIKSGMISNYETYETRATNTLQRVFQEILSRSVSVMNYKASNSVVYSSSVSSSSGYELQVSNYTGHGELSSEQVYRLCSIVKMLNSSEECLWECIRVYKISRRNAVVARLMRFGICDLSYSDGEKFAANIKLGIQATNKCYNSIFPGELQYYEQIFYGVRDVTYDSCFLDIVKHAAKEMNNLAKVSPYASFHNLFAVLDLYKAMLVILPEIQNMFHGVSSAYISSEASDNIKSLATLVRKLFLSFQDVVLNESSNNLSPKGAVHYMTEYTVSYVNKILLYEELLTITLSTQNPEYEADDQFLEASGGTLLQLHMLRIMMSLRINLERKSIRIMMMFGYEYQSKLSKDIWQAAQDYFSSIWHKVLYCLRHDGLNYNFPFYKGILKNSVKKRLKTFNTLFEKFCQSEPTRFVTDTQLRGQIHNLILNKLLTDYKSFLEKFGHHIHSERYKERYIKYTPEDLQNKVQSLYSEHLIAHNGTEDIAEIT